MSSTYFGMIGTFEQDGQMWANYRKDGPSHYSHPFYPYYPYYPHCPYDNRYPNYEHSKARSPHKRFNTFSPVEQLEVQSPDEQPEVQTPPKRRVQSPAEQPKILSPYKQRKAEQDEILQLIEQLLERPTERPIEQPKIPIILVSGIDQRRTFYFGCKKGKSNFKSNYLRICVQYTGDVVTVVLNVKGTVTKKFNFGTGVIDITQAIGYKNGPHMVVNVNGDEILFNEMSGSITVIGRCLIFPNEKR